jgi:hypothetical protein
MGEFAGMDSFEVVFYLVVFPETAPFIEISSVEFDFSG